MKKFFLISILLTSFTSASEEINIQTQAIVEKVSTALQDLGRGYARDAKSNQIYYNGKLVNVYSPKTFKIINGENENGDDAEDYYSYYKKGWSEIRNDRSKAKVPIEFGPGGLFDSTLHIPLECFDDKDNKNDLVKCYQKKSFGYYWSKYPIVEPNKFKILEKVEHKLLDESEKMERIWFVADDDKVVAFFKVVVRDEIATINGVQDLSTFSLVGLQINYFMYISQHYMLDRAYLYVKDQHNVYIGEPHNFYTSKPLLKILESHSEESRKIEGADPATFEVLGFPYAKDKNHVYYKGNILKNTISTDFELLDYRLRIARNQKNIFYQDQILKDFDTFRVINSPSLPIWNKHYYTCPVALLFDQNKFFYADIQSLLSPDQQISVTVDGNSYITERLHGFVSLPLSLDTARVQVIQTSISDCRELTYIVFKTEDFVYVLYRKGDAMTLTKTDKVDVATFELDTYGVLRDKGHHYIFSSSKELEIGREGLR